MSRVRLLPVLAAAWAAASACDDLLAPDVLLRFSSVAAGAEHTCATTTEGEVYCWGAGELGQLGTRGVEGSALPRRVPTDVTFTKVTAGVNHTCGIAVDDLAHCWGWNVLGATGTGAFDAAIPPAVVAGMRRFVSLSAGWHHTCGVAAGGVAYCWGANAQGQLGDGSTTNSPAPVAVAGGLRFERVSAGAFHTCGITTDQAAYCWGLNHMGQLGTGTTTNSLVPVRVAGRLRFTWIGAGFAHTCAVAANGRAYCWGSNVHGELGNTAIVGGGLPGSTVPSEVFGGQVFVAVEAGRHVSCGIAPGGRGFCWGDGGHGQLGNGFLVDHATPQWVNAASGAAGPDVLAFRELSPHGLTHVCGVTDASAVFCWGRGERGQLGIPGTIFSPQPVRIVVAR